MPLPEYLNGHGEKSTWRQEICPKSMLFSICKNLVYLQGSKILFCLTSGHINEKSWKCLAMALLLSDILMVVLSTHTCVN